MNPKKIVIDGQTYSSVDEMPPDVRKKYELAIQALTDANGNHIPDALENILFDKDKDGMPDVLKDPGVQTHVTSHIKIMVDGQEYNGIENLPPEIRIKYETAMSKLDANKNGVPDFVGGMLNASNQNQPIPASTGFTIESPPYSEPIPVSPVIAPDTSNGLMIVLAGLFIFLLCVAAGGAVWYFFLR